MTGLNFPTSVLASQNGDLIVTECGLGFGGAPVGGRVLIGDGEKWKVIAQGLRPPVNSAVPFEDGFLVTEGGHPARLRWVDRTGSSRTVIDGFVGPGNYQIGGLVVDEAGWIYVGVGSMTNSGVVGPDGLSIGWLRKLRHAHDTPGVDVELAGVDYAATDPQTGQSVQTGAFQSFGVATRPGQRVVAGRLPTASVIRCRPDGSNTQLVAWGIRNAYCLSILSSGQMVAVDQGADERGSRPLHDVPDFLWHIEAGRWYGWPDYMGGVPVTDPRFRPTLGPRPTFVLANHAQLGPPAEPLVRFSPHVAATRLIEIPMTSPVYPGQLLVALFGDERPMTAPAGPRVGRCLMRVDPADWSQHPIQLEGVHRPIDLVLVGNQLGVLDFGMFEIGVNGSLDARPQSGGLHWLPLQAIRNSRPWAEDPRPAPTPSFQPVERPASSAHV